MADDIRGRQWELLRLSPFEAWPLSGGQKSLRRPKKPARLRVDTRDRHKMSHDTLPPVLTLEQAAGYLQLTAAELDAELEGGKIPAWKVAGKWRIKRDVLARLLERAPSDPAPLPQSEIPESSLRQGLPADPAATYRFQPAAATVAADRQSPSSPLPLASSRSSLEEPPSPSRASAPALGPSTNDRRLHGRVYAYNSKEQFGHARMADNRVVWVDFKHLVDQSAEPSLGDTIEFDLHRSPRRGLEALAITIVAKDEKPPRRAPSRRSPWLARPVFPRPVSDTARRNPASAYRPDRRDPPSRLRGHPSHRAPIRTLPWPVPRGGSMTRVASSGNRLRPGEGRTSTRRFSKWN